MRRSSNSQLESSLEIGLVKTGKGFASMCSFKLCNSHGLLTANTPYISAYYISVYYISALKSKHRGIISSVILIKSCTMVKLSLLCMMES